MNPNPVHIMDLMMKADAPADFNQLQENADFKTLLTQHKIESADLQNVLISIKNCKSDCMRNVFLNQLGSVSNSTRSYRINSEINKPVEHLEKQAQQILDAGYWEALGVLLRTRNILPYESHGIFDKYKKVYIDEQYYPFTQENINQAIEELNAFFNTDDIATEFQKAKAGIEIKTYASGNLEIRSHPDTCGYYPLLSIKAADLFKKWWHQINYGIHAIELIESSANNKEIAWEQTGSYSETLKSGIAILKLNKKMANKFCQITGYTPK